MEKRIYYYKLLSITALVILIPIDSISTLLAANKYGARFEANRLMRESLQNGTLEFLKWKLIAGIAAGILLYILIKYILRVESEYKGMISLAFEVWVSLLIFFGLFIAMNNFIVYFTGKSIIGIIILSIL